MKANKSQFSGIEWTFSDLERAWTVIHKAGLSYNWEGYATQIEIINNQQMSEILVNHGLPIQFPYWKNGRNLAAIQHDFNEHGNHILELIINTNPSICYLMDHNTLARQLLVIAHAGVGHNHFFKHNYCFREWDYADTILDLLIAGQKFILRCEELYGVKEVEKTLDVAYFLASYSIQHYPHSEKTKLERQNQLRSRIENVQQRFNEVLDTDRSIDERKHLINGKEFDREESVKADLPSESILEFLENLPPQITKVKNWQKEIFRLVRLREQYFYPQVQTKLMNEGFATFVQYEIFNKLHKDRIFDDSIMLEFFAVNSSCTAQFQFSPQTGQELNPYFLGGKLFNDIKRICETPTEEDKRYFPDIANTDWISTINNIVRNYRDESFIHQFLSPNLIRKLRLFSLETTERKSVYTIDGIHDEDNYETIKQKLADQYSPTRLYADIKISLMESSTRLPTIYLGIHNPLENKLTSDSLIGISSMLADLTGLENIIKVFDSREVCLQFTSSGE